MSAVSFPSFPSGWRLPLFWSEVDPSMAGGGNPLHPALLVGQVVSGAANPPPAGVPIAVGSASMAISYFGAGSMLARMCARFLAINPSATLFALPIADPGSGVAATGKITVSTGATGAGVLTIYIAGQAVEVAVGATDTMATIATNTVAAVNAIATLPVTATIGTTGHTNDVDLLCNWLGSTGNDIQIQPNYLGAANDEFLPAGVTLAIVPMASGAGNPSWSAPIAALGDDVYYYTGMPYTDTVSLQAWDTEYGFTQGGRWGWMRQLYGNVYGAIRGSYSTLVSWGPTGNSGVESIMGVEPSSPSPVWEWTAAYTAQAAAGFEEDPARPLQTLELTGIIPATKTDRWTKAEANTLAGVGVAVQQLGSNGYPVIMVECSRYQVNAFGAADIAYNLVTTLTTLAALLTAMKSAITSKFPRSKLADDGTNFATGQAIVTPKVIRGEIISEYLNAEYNGLVEDSDTFSANLVVERSTTNPNRVDVLYPPNLIGQLRIFAVLAQFRLLGASPQPLSV